MSLLMEDEESFFLCLVLLYLSPDFNIFFCCCLRQDFVGFLTPYVTEDDLELLILLPSQALGLLYIYSNPNIYYYIYYCIYTVYIGLHYTQL